MKTYILKKDFSVPGMFIQAGSEGKEKNSHITGISYQFCNENGCKFFSEREVLNNPDWFLLKEEK